MTWPRFPPFRQRKRLDVDAFGLGRVLDVRNRPRCFQRFSEESLVFEETRQGDPAEAAAGRPEKLTAVQAGKMAAGGRRRRGSVFHRPSFLRPGPFGVWVFDIVA